jgi:hypothetical protein
LLRFAAHLPPKSQKQDRFWLPSHVNPVDALVEGAFAFLKLVIGKNRLENI